jgi:hypothetical protein
VPIRRRAVACGDTAHARPLHDQRRRHCVLMLKWLSAKVLFGTRSKETRLSCTKGVFGVPSFLFVGGDLYWEREHLPRIREILAAR